LVSIARFASIGKSDVVAGSKAAHFPNPAIGNLQIASWQGIAFWPARKESTLR
jgi:hypothetical protein